MISKCKTIILSPRNNYMLLMFWYFLLLLILTGGHFQREQKGGRKEERETGRHKDTSVKETYLLAPPELAPTGARVRTCNPGTCPCALDRESSLRPFRAQVDTLTTEPGQFGYFFVTYPLSQSFQVAIAEYRRLSGLNSKRFLQFLKLESPRQSSSSCVVW